MMPSRKDNLYIIRMRGSISSVKPRWWASNTFRLSSTRYALLCSLLKEVKVPVTVKYLVIEMFHEYAFKFWYLMVIFYGKIDESFISRKDTGIGAVALRESASYGTIYVPLCSRRFEIFKKYIL